MAETAPPARATPPLLKHLNERTVLETIRALAPISRAEISRRANISKPTVSLALQSLLDAGLVREAADAPGGPSYGAVFFEPVPDAAYVLGLDLGHAVPARSGSATSPVRCALVRTSSCAAPTPMGRCWRSAGCTNP
jgi:Predicted transcriptional regulator